MVWFLVTMWVGRLQASASPWPWISHLGLGVEVRWCWNAPDAACAQGVGMLLRSVVVSCSCGLVVAISSSSLLLINEGVCLRSEVPQMALIVFVCTGVVVMAFSVCLLLVVLEVGELGDDRSYYYG